MRLSSAFFASPGDHFHSMPGTFPSLLTHHGARDADRTDCRFLSNACQVARLLTENGYAASFPGGYEQTKRGSGVVLAEAL